jgi:hypothetical protein
MDSKIVKESLEKLKPYIPSEIPAMGWYFQREEPADAVIFEKNKWTCMFQHIEKIASGNSLCFSSGLTGCGGAACYLGFKTPSPQAGRFLAEEEGFKKWYPFTG